MTGRVRAATADDVPALAALEAALFGADAWSAASLAAELDAPGRSLDVRVEDGRVVGWALTILAGDVVDLARIGVHPAHRRRGVARQLLDRVLGEARAAGAARALLEVSSDNVDALAFYADRGFVRIDVRPRYYRDGTDAIILQRRLDSGVPEEEGRR